MRSDPHRFAKPRSTEDPVLDAQENTFNLAHTYIGVHLRKRLCITEGTVRLQQPRGRFALIAKNVQSRSDHPGQPHEAIRFVHAWASLHLAAG